MAIKYKPAIIQQFAEKLYEQAGIVLVIYTLIGVVSGAATGSLFSLYRTKTLYVLIGAAVGGLLGYVLGQYRAFMLRLQAQQALCQMKIEENTRRGGRVQDIQDDVDSKMVI